MDDGESGIAESGAVGGEVFGLNLLNLTAKLDKSPIFILSPFVWPAMLELIWLEGLARYSEPL